MGNWGLPEFGISELFGGKKSSLSSAPTNQSNLQSYIANNFSNPTTTYKAPTTTYKAPTPTKVPTGGGGGGGGGGDGQPKQPNQPTFNPIEDQQKQLRRDISSGWDSYINSLDAQLEGLSGQRVAQEGIAGSQYQQGANTLGLQREQGLQSLGQNRTEAEQNQARNLRDISESIRNAFMAGNIYLGSRGAGDSSAADQYSYALNKMGTQQRSGVMNETANIMADINSRETNLNNIYNTETNNLAEQKNQQIQQITTWFNDAQNQISNMKSQGQLGKSQDLATVSRSVLDQAINHLNQINQTAINKKQALDQWAMGVSDNINSLKSNMQQASQISMNLPQATDIFGQPRVSQSTQAYNYGGYGGYDEDKNKLFG